MRLLVVLLLSIACNNEADRQVETRTVVIQTETCTVAKEEEGTVILCPDGSSAVVKDGNSIIGPAGERGDAGPPGEAGKNGSSCTVLQTDTGATLLCDNTSVQIMNGVDGNSIQGPAGEDGVGCTVEQQTDGATILCGEKSVTINDGAIGLPGERGEKGAAGAEGAPGTVITPVVPCPSKAGSFPEVLMCIDDHLYAVFVGGTGGNAKEVRYSEIPAGLYQTTDGRACVFRVTIGCTLTY